MRDGGRVEALGEALEQRIAGGMAVGVVVLLEAVEVEDREQQLVLGLLGDRAGEIVGHRATVAEAGQLVGARLVDRDPEERLLLAHHALDGGASRDRAQVEERDRDDEDRGRDGARLGIAGGAEHDEGDAGGDGDERHEDGQESNAAPGHEPALVRLRDGAPARATGSAPETNSSIGIGGRSGGNLVNTK